MKNLFKHNLLLKLIFSALLFVSFNAVNAAVPVNQYSVNYVDVNTATLVGAGGLIMKTIDAGQTWQQQTSGTTEVLYANDQMGTNNGIAVGENGTILVTVDGGITWTLKTSGTNEHLKDVQMISSNVFIVCGENGTVLRTDDAGETWTAVTSGTTDILNDIQFIDVSNGFIVGDNSNFLTSNDQGTTWNVVNTGLPSSRFNAVFMFDVNTGTVVGEAGLIINTIDGGLSWTPNEGQSFTDDFNDVKFLNGTGIAVGNHGLIAKVNAGSSSWYGSYGSINAALYSVNFADGSNATSVGQDGLRVFTQDGGSLWFSYESTSIFAQLVSPSNHTKINPKSYDAGVTPGQFFLNQNYPNPFNPSTKISYNLPVDAKVTLQIFDLTGREVMSLANGFQVAGSYTVQVNAKGMSSGVYFYRILADAGSQKFVKTMKMILTK